MQVAADAASCLRGDRVRHVPGDLAPPVDVRLRVQRRLGRLDRLQERGEDAIAIDQQLRLVAVRDRRSGERLRGAQEVLGVDLDLGRDVVAERALASVAQAVRGVPAARCRRRGPSEPVLAPGALPARLPAPQPRWLDADVAGPEHQGATTSNARGRTVNRSEAASTSSPSTLKLVRVSVSTSTSRPSPVDHAGVALDPAGAHAVGMQREARPRAALDHDHVEDARREGRPRRRRRRRTRRCTRRSPARRGRRTARHRRSAPGSRAAGRSGRRAGPRPCRRAVPARA